MHHPQCLEGLKIQDKAGNMVSVRVSWEQQLQPRLWSHNEKFQVWLCYLLPV